MSVDPGRTGRKSGPEVPLSERLAWRVPEYSALIGQSVAATWNRIAEGKLKATRVGGCTFITREHHEELFRGDVSGRRLKKTPGPGAL